MATLLSINTYFFLRGGPEAVYLGHNSLFSAAGWRVVPFSMHHAENLSSPWDEHFVDEIELGRAYTLAQKLRRVPKVVYSLEARDKLRGLLERARPDIGHCHNIYHHISPSILGVLARAGIPTVMTLHDLKLACPAYHMFDGHGICERCNGGRTYNVLLHRCIKGSAMLSAVILLEALVNRLLRSYANVQRFIVPSEFYASRLAEWGWERSRFVHVPNFVDVDAIEPSYAPGDAFLYLGRLYPEKGLLTLIHAAARARVPLRFAGSGPQQPVLQREASRLGADVRFLGHLSGRKLIDEVRGARATVLPSEWYENGPISVLESLAAGTPVIGADIGGIPELIEPGLSGWLFPSGSVDALTDLLTHVAAMPDAQLAEMGQAARDSAQRRFSPGQYRRRIEDVYAGLGVG